MAKRRIFARDRRGRFARTGGGSRSRRSRAATAGLATAGALGALYAVDGKGGFRTAGYALAIGASAVQGVRTQRRKRRAPRQ